MTSVAKIAFSLGDNPVIGFFASSRLGSGLPFDVVFGALPGLARAVVFDFWVAISDGTALGVCVTELIRSMSFNSAAVADVHLEVERTAFLIKSALSLGEVMLWLYWEEPL